MCKAITFLGQILSAGDPLPLPKDLVPVHERLHQLGYSSRAILQALTAIQSTGTAWCSESVNDEDLAEIERLIPGGGAATWTHHTEDDRWTSAGHPDPEWDDEEDEPEAHECFDGCDICRDEARFRRALLRPAGGQRSPDDSDLERTEAF
jgi:hypothetical protein